MKAKTRAGGSEPLKDDYTRLDPAPRAIVTLVGCKVHATSANSMPAALDPNRYFCSMLCAAMFGVTCAEQREIAALSQARRERKAQQ